MSDSEKLGRFIKENGPGYAAPRYGLDGEMYAATFYADNGAELTVPWHWGRVEWDAFWKRVRSATTK